jgi:hypothetical protein
MAVVYPHLIPILVVACVSHGPPSIAIPLVRIEAFVMTVSAADEAPPPRVVPLSSATTIVPVAPTPAPAPAPTPATPFSSRSELSILRLGSACFLLGLRLLLPSLLGGHRRCAYGVRRRPFRRLLWGSDGGALKCLDAVNVVLRKGRLGGK